MEAIWQELTLGLSDASHIAHIVIRLLGAALLGAVIGFERERKGKQAGLRTHILVCLGACVFVLTGTCTNMNPDGLSRIVQGIVTGVGFLGAGSIIQVKENQDIQGLTTAAGLWLTTAVGVAIAFGALGLAILATLAALLVLTLANTIERQFGDKDK